MAETTTIDTSQIATELLNELNLDGAELKTITTLVTTAVEIIKRSSDAQADDSLTIPAIKTLTQAMYYDRSLANGVPKGLLMMLVHLQAGGDTNGN
ncbi:hypothetical protein [Lacticaseibacillus sp. 866-1]|uniref:hypothetical protein n=1 Tax=Lacticaseibacillus sp. 866-1 TaxID=2799576 RepID=UPI00194141B3|nr:hypothetical protein [Lacticaseibacillus sp. 866-1]